MPAKGRQFQPRLEFTVHNRTGRYKVDAYHPVTGEPVGSMNWDDNGTVGHVSVKPEHRRQGIATQLWNEGQRVAGMPPATCTTPGCGQTHIIPAPRHSSSRTPDGDAWAKSVGGEIPS
jgi:GNAT superfamily N-acetyltransferase